MPASIGNPPQRNQNRATPSSRRPFFLLIVLPVIAVLLIFGWLFIRPHIWYWTYSPQEGDVLFQSLPHGALTNAIEGSTHSPWSHCGIVARERDQWVVYEAYGSVQHVPLDTFWKRTRRHQFAVYRWKQPHDAQINDILAAVRTRVGLPYDAKYEMDDEKIYCSELIYKAFHDVTGQPMGDLVRLDDLNWQPYEQTIRQLEGGPPPLDRMMITPRGLSEAPQLYRVTSLNVE